MDRHTHWTDVYRARRPDEVSWFQPRTELSRAMIERLLPDREAPILDVGGGASRLAAELRAAGYRDITVLDLAAAALAEARRAVGATPSAQAPTLERAAERAPDRAGSRIRWVVADMLATPLADGAVALWHDRAAFHFLTDPGDRDRYRDEMRRVLRPGGLALVATFAEDGPDRCSGLPVVRYGPREMEEALGDGVELLESLRETHRTPSGSTQAFRYFLCRRR